MHKIPNKTILFLTIALVFVFIFLSISYRISLEEKTADYRSLAKRFLNWIVENSDTNTGLPHSHVGDERFRNWAITYDSAVATLAYIATQRIERAKRVLDFYIENPNVWRLGGVIEAINPGNPALGEDWSVRTGSNLWLGIASFHLYRATGEDKYLDLSKKIADFALSLQNTDEKDVNFGGIRLGPLGTPNIPSDQHIGYDLNKPSFYDIFATEHNIDAYALLNMLYKETEEERYRYAKDNVLDWLRDIAYNKEKHRFNRGYVKDAIDTSVATDAHSWGISALGIDILDTFELGLAEKMVEFIEKNCVSEVSFTKPDGKKVNVTGVDFIDRSTASQLGRDPLVTPEWTYQLINAYRRLEYDYRREGDKRKEAIYRKKRQNLTKSILNLAIESDDTLAYPYASHSEAIIGHEYKTPRTNNLSTIGASYAVLGLLGYDPLYIKSHKLERQN